MSSQSRGPPDDDPGLRPGNLLHGSTSLVDVSLSRVRILKELDASNATVSELARSLDLNKSTVHGYLQELVEEDLVERLDREDRLWVYYTLTERGREFIAGDQLAVEIDLGDLL